MKKFSVIIFLTLLGCNYKEINKDDKKDEQSLTEFVNQQYIHYFEQQANGMTIGVFITNMSGNQSQQIKIINLTKDSFEIELIKQQLKTKQ